MKIDADSKIETTMVEIECLGSANRGDINAHCIISGCDIQIDHDKKEIICNEYLSIPMAGYTRKDGVNYCKFEIPEKAYCNYVRTIQTEPAIHERKWFKIENGEMIVLGDVKGGMSPTFAVEEFFREYLKLLYKARYGKIPFGKRGNQSGLKGQTV